MHSMNIHINYPRRMVGIQPVKAHSQLLVDPVLQQNLCFRLVPKLLATGHGFPTMQANETHLKYDKIFCTEVQSCLLCLSIEIVVFLSLSLFYVYACMHRMVPYRSVNV